MTDSTRTSAAPPPDAGAPSLDEDWSDGFARRHIGPRPDDLDAMLATVGAASLDELIAQAVPAAIRHDELALPPGRSEPEVLAELAALAGENQVFTSLIGMGYSATHTPGVIQRNILENPA